MEPTSALSYYDLILAVAREAGMAYHGSSGNERGMIPIDAHDIDLCKDVVNQGIRMFIADAPVRGWRWMRRLMSITFALTYTGTAEAGTATTLTDTTIATTYADNYFNDYIITITAGTGVGETATITDYDGTLGKFTFAAGLSAGSTPTVTTKYRVVRSADIVDNDGSRYYLAENFGGEVDGPIKYAASTGHGGPIDWCDESRIRALRAVSVQSGHPSLAAIRLLEPTASGTETTRRWELIVDPQPTAVESVEFPYTLYFDKLRLEVGEPDAAGATYIIDADRDEPISYFDGWMVRIISGTAKGAYGAVTAYDSREGVAICTDGGLGTISVASTAHGMATDDIVTISGTTDYDGMWTITRVDDDNYTFVDTWTSDQTGTWKQRQIEVAGWLKDTGVSAGINPDSTSIYYLEPVRNLHPAGFRFDQAILAACLAKAEMLIEDMTAGWVNMYKKTDLSQAHQIDARSAPRQLGNMDGREHRDRYWKDVTTDHDV